MPKGRKTDSATTKKVVARPKPRSLAISSRGVNTAMEFSQFMSLLIHDVISGAVSCGVANAACNAGGKLLKVVEMQHKYGSVAEGMEGRKKVLVLTS